MALRTIPMTDSIASFSHTSVRVFQMQPYPWQTEVGATIIDYACRKTPKTTLLVMPTSKGKSAVQHVYGAVFGGVTLALVPLLSLAADQLRKLNARVNHTKANVTAFHLDELKKTPDSLQRLLRGLSDLPPTTAKTTPTTMTKSVLRFFSRRWAPKLS
jgi:hypothetical protein